MRNSLLITMSNIIPFFEGARDITGGHSSGVQGQYLTDHASNPRLIFPDHLGFIFLFHLFTCFSW
ncbi:hypothetical protein [Xenorhabdus koppenhoeferi]|uniref:hypothetical protein n=1 Tax=Xenorhabdus koppenhoeferi TaxID=351659 RepID=UPI003BB715CC